MKLLPSMIFILSFVYIKGSFLCLIFLFETQMILCLFYQVMTLNSRELGKQNLCDFNSQ